jgi:hypothetical protein
VETERCGALLRQIAGWGLVEERTRLDVPSADGEWSQFLQLVAAHRLSGLLDAAIRASDVTVDDRQVCDVENLHRRVSTKVLLLDTTLVRVAAELSKRDIPLRVLKGPAAAALYPDPLWRPYVDVDLLVPGDRFADAAGALADLGYQRRSIELRPGFDRRFGKGATFHREAGANLDLHRTLVAGPYAFLIDPASLFDRPSAFDVSGTRLGALSPEARFIHSCISVMLSDAEPKLITLRDVVQTYRNPELDSDEVRQLCGAWRIGHVVGAAANTVNTILALPESACLPIDLVAPSASITERVAAWGYRAQKRRWRRQALTAIPFVQGWSDRAAYLRAVLTSRPIGTD